MAVPATHLYALPLVGGRCYVGSTHNSDSYAVSKGIQISGETLSTPLSTPSEREADSEECFRCGRPGHWADDCYARKHISGETISGQRVDDCYASSSSIRIPGKAFMMPDKWQSIPKKCLHCGRPGHRADDCYARSSSVPS